MRKIGIDFGTKKIGIALTDAAGNMAFPHSVIPNDEQLLPKLVQVIEEEKVTEVVIGQSLDFAGTPNPVQAAIESFIADLTLQVPIPIHLEPEQLTSVEAARTVGKNTQTDAGAAAIILNTYLERTKSAGSQPPELVEAAQSTETNAVPEISFEQFMAVEIKVGTIISVAIVESADKLLCLTVDVGEQTPRQIVSGIREFFEDEQVLVNRQCPFVTNLPPRKIRGIESQGMILAGATDDTFSLFHPAANLPPGTRLS